MISSGLFGQTRTIFMAEDLGDRERELTRKRPFTQMLLPQSLVSLGCFFIFNCILTQTYTIDGTRCATVTQPGPPRLLGLHTRLLSLSLSLSLARPTHCYTVRHLHYPFRIVCNSISFSLSSGTVTKTSNIVWV